eukprot:jgi/Bigna1/85794/estExt_fgenesh1_pg.C_60136
MALTCNLPRSRSRSSRSRRSHHSLPALTIAGCFVGSGVMLLVAMLAYGRAEQGGMVLAQTLGATRAMGVNSMNAARLETIIRKPGSLRNRLRGSSPVNYISGKGRVANCNAQTAAPNDFPELKNDLLLRAARGEETEQVPVWIHRQAGRYLPEFLSIAEANGYMKCFNTPEIAADLTVQPIERYGMDAAILFSDILVLLPVMGIEWKFTAGVEPYAVNAISSNNVHIIQSAISKLCRARFFTAPISTPEDVERTLPNVDDVDIREKLGYVLESVGITRRKLDGRAPLIASTINQDAFVLRYVALIFGRYTMHGQESNGRDNSLEFISKYPEAAEKILQTAKKLVVKYLIAKVESGAQMLQVFDSWAGILSEEDFKKYSLPYLLEIATEVKSGLRAKGIEPVPMTVFPRGCGHSLAAFETSDYDCVSLDENVDPAEARKQLPSKTLQGNFQGKFIYDDEATIRKEASEMVGRFGTQRYIANFGYAVEKQHSPEKIGVFVDEIRKSSRK